MPIVEFDGQTYEYEDGISDEQLLDFFKQQAPKQKEPPLLLPEDTERYIKDNEGYSDKPYRDTKGKRTIGYGFNLDDSSNQQLAKNLNITFDRPIDTPTADRLFKHKAMQAEDDVKSLDPDYDNRPPQVKKVLLDMAYNMGRTSLSGFKDFFEALNNNDYHAAAKAIQHSDYAKDVPIRARNNRQLLLSAVTAPPVNSKQHTNMYEPGYYEDENGSVYVVDNNGAITLASGEDIK